MLRDCQGIALLFAKAPFQTCESSMPETRYREIKTEGLLVGLIGLGRIQSRGLGSMIYIITEQISIYRDRVIYLIPKMYVCIYLYIYIYIYTHVFYIYVYRYLLVDCTHPAFLDEVTGGIERVAALTRSQSEVV